MKKLIKICLFFGLISLISFSISDKNKTLKIGKTAPLKEMKMKDISGNDFSINDLNQKNGLLVIFSCNTCPFVIGNDKNEGWESRYNQIYRTANDNQVGMVLINSNEAKRKGDDSFDNMKKRSLENNYKAPYLIDKNNKLADAFGANTTPHVFLFNKDLKLVYTGAIDDAVKSSKDVEEKWLENALNDLGVGKKIKPNKTRNSGCSIKRV